MNSKLIGNEWEREIAKKLSFWFTQDKNELIVWRSIDSGSISTMRQKKGKGSISEDIVLLDHAPIKYKAFFQSFYLEAKSRKEISFNFLKNNKSLFPVPEWKETIKKCPPGKKPIMLCQVRDRKTPLFVCLHSSMIMPKELCPTIIVNSLSLYLVTLEDFFAIPWDTYLELNYEDKNHDSA